MLAAKASLALRVDALGEDVTADLGIEHRARLEIRLKSLEEGFVSKFKFLCSLTQLVHLQFSCDIFGGFFSTRASCKRLVMINFDKHMSEACAVRTLTGY